MGNEFIIGNRRVRIPVVQGGMGVGISLSGLAGAVAKEGGIGIISTAQIGYRYKDYDTNPLKCNLEAISTELKRAKDIAGDGIVGVNIMVATSDYELYVKEAVKAKADIIISGAGLPSNLPELVEGSDAMIAPIVSSVKAAKLILKLWMKKYNRLPDMMVIEGPLAGGHLGFDNEALLDIPGLNYDEEIREIIEHVNDFAKVVGAAIPVVVAGGVYDRSDYEHYKQLGASGVQIATRFVATHECDADIRYKMAYINAQKEDVIIVKSPVGMPARALNNDFMKRVNNGERIMGKCRNCVKTCDRCLTPYCISEALINAVKGEVDKGLIFCGANVHRVKEIVSVKSIMKEFDECL